MLGDVVEAARGVGRVVVVTDDPSVVPASADVVARSRWGPRSCAVAAALAQVDGHALVVNADLPAATAASIRRLADAGLALVEARDGTTNALSLPDPSVFAPLYGPGSADRFRSHAPFATVSIPELEADVDCGRGSRAPRAGSRASDARASRRSGVRIVLLSGGGGGARFARGLADVLGPDELTVIGNVGDDVEVLGLHVSPDLDSLLYTLGGLIDVERGWGRADETWNALDSAASFGGEDWFRLGDRDIGLHLVRTRALRDGVPLSEVTSELARRIGRDRAGRPCDRRPPPHACADACRTVFVSGVVRRPRPRDEVDGVEYEGADEARPAPGIARALADADALLFAPSNPFLSIGPILAVGAIREAIEHRGVRCVAVSPLVGGAAVTGPAARMLTRMAGGASPSDVAGCYRGSRRRPRHRRVAMPRQSPASSSSPRRR